MSQKIMLSIQVETNASATPEEIAAVVQRLIDAGLSDAQDTIKEGEGDVEGAELATCLHIRAPQVIGCADGKTSINVKHWDAYHVEGTVDTHQFDIEDQRNTSGQAYITVGALEGDLDDMLSVTMEVNANPIGIEHVPCAHVHFDGDAIAFSLFKIGGSILLRPERGVEIEPVNKQVYGTKELMYWVK